MSKFLKTLCIALIISACSNNKTVLLPEIETAEITLVKDVSPAYIFYDETQSDSTLLNRKNLIISTNWLVNIDKRLTLRQSMPHIQFLQNKKRTAKMHKNEAAKNYFTCNDISNKNLGFMEFTDIIYLDETKEEFFNPKEEMHREEYRINVFKKFENHSSDNYPTFIELVVESKDKIHFNDTSYFTIQQLESKIDSVVNSQSALFLIFNSNLSFQDYITFKHKLLALETDDFKISDHEIIYN